jgi:hypothetical protein
LPESCGQAESSSCRFRAVCRADLLAGWDMPKRTQPGVNPLFPPRHHAPDSDPANIPHDNENDG